MTPLSSNDTLATAAPSRAAPPLPRWLPQALSFFSSAAIMVLELVAGRLVAEHVGSSNYTWIAIIAVVLMGMSLGSAIGGRLSDRLPAARLLERWFLGAAVAIQLPILLSPLVRILKPWALRAILDYPEGSALLWGMMVFWMMTVIFLLPAVVLGMLSPMIGRLALTLEAIEGRAIGNVWSWGALGSILAVFSTGYLWVPTLPVPAILLVCSLVMGCLALGVRWMQGRLPGTPSETDSARELDSPESSTDLPGTGEAAASKLQTLLPVLLYACTSACLMMVELVAGRQVTRFVGSSLYTWSTVIGIIFAGMSLGNHLGGRLSTRLGSTHPLRSGIVLLLAGAGVSCVLMLYTHPLLDTVLYKGDWPSGFYRVDARLELPPRAIRQLELDGFPPEILERLKTASLKDGRHLGAFKAELAREVPGLSESQLSMLAERARLGGPAIDQLRGAGLPEAVIEGLRPLIQRTFLRGFSDNIKEQLFDARRMEEYTRAERNHFLYEIEQVSWNPSAFAFPVRLFIATGIVYLPTAVLLGMLSPLLTLLALKTTRGRGEVLGRMGAWGAWGSILGTLLAGFFLIRLLGTLLLLHATALLLVGLALCLRPHRKAMLFLLCLLVLLGLPLLQQRLEPDALTELDPDPLGLSSPSPSTGPLAAISAAIEESVRIRNPDLGANAIESDYQYLRAGVAQIEGPPTAYARQLRKLNLDRLIHGYLMLRMPGEKEAPFDAARARFDPTHLEYDYERVYAVVTGRAVGAMVRMSDGTAAPPPELNAPPITSLSLGGGTYTFPRYLLATYPAQKVECRPGETLAQLLSRTYGRNVDADLPDVTARVLSTQPIGGLREGSPLKPGTVVWVPSLSDVAELDPLVTAINYSRFKLPRFNQDPRLKTWNHDARNVVEAFVSAGWVGRYDVIFGDAFNHYSIPYHLTTLEFNAQVKKLLKPKGVFIANVIDNYQKSRFLSAYYTTLSRLYRHVVLIGARDEGGRFGRETFVIAASDTVLDLDLLGGVELDGLEALEQGSASALLSYLETAEGADMNALRHKVMEAYAITEQGAPPPTDLIDRLYARNLTDLHLMGLPMDSQALTALVLADEERATGRQFQAFTQAEVETLVRQGQMPSVTGLLRSLLPVRLLLGRPSAFVALSPEALRRLESLDLPPALLEGLRALEGQQFAQVSTLLDVLSRTCAPDMIERYQHQFLPPLLERPSRRPPLVLTDAFAPTEELTSILFEDAAGK